MPLKLRPSEVHGDAAAQCGALYCPRRFRFDLDEAKGRVVGTFPLAPSRQDSLILFETVAQNLALWCKEYSNYVYW